MCQRCSLADRITHSRTLHSTEPVDSSPVTASTPPAGILSLVLLTQRTLVLLRLILHASADTDLRTPGSRVAAQADYVGRYSNSALRPVSNYVQRSALHEKIKNQLHDTGEDAARENKVLVVNGLGGAGKSQLVLNYVQECGADYSAVFWIEAGQKQTIERDYLQIHRLLFDYPSGSAQSTVKIEDAVPAVKSWFHGRKGRWLVVLDSADSIDNEQDPSHIDLTYFLPDAPGVDVVITSRSWRAKDMTQLEAIDVSEMEPAEAAKLFTVSAKLQDIGHDTEAEVALIVEELGRLALAITLAGAHVAATPRLSSDIRRYLPKYRKQRKELLSRKPQWYIYRYSESVLSTWETSFHAIATHSPVASRLLSLLAFLNFDDIFLDLFGRTSSVDEHGSETQSWQTLILPEGPLDTDTLDSAFEVLQTYSLIQWKPNRESYSMHKLVHAWGHDRLDVQEQSRLSLGALQLLGEVMSVCSSNPIMKARLRPHLMANFVISSALYDSLNLPDMQRLHLIDSVGKFLNTAGYWSDVAEIRRFYSRNLREILGAEHPDTLSSMNKLALVLSYQGKYEEAEEMHRQVLKLREGVLGQEYPDTLTSMNNLASVLMKQGKYAQAEEMHRQVLKLRERVLGQEHPDTLTSMNNLGLALEGQGEYAQAEEMHRQVLKLIERVLGQEHPDTLISMDNLGLALEGQGEYAQAEEMHRQVLKLRERVLGQEHPDTSTSMNNLGLALGNQGKYAQAEEMHRQVLKLRERVLGQEHPDTLTSMAHLAWIHWKQRRWDESENLWKRVVEMHSRVLGQKHPHTLGTMAHLAHALKSQGRNQDAIALMRQAERLQREILGPDHPDAINSSEWLRFWLATDVNEDARS